MIDFAAIRRNEFQIRIVVKVSMRFRFREKNFNSIGSGTVYSFAVQIAIEKASRNAGVCT